MPTPSIQKVLESFEEKFGVHVEGQQATEYLPYIESFLTTALEEIAQAEYKRGLEDAKEKIIEADKQIGDCYPFLTTENDADKEQMDKYNKLVYFFFHKVMENALAAIDALLKKKKI